LPHPDSPAYATVPPGRRCEQVFLSIRMDTDCQELTPRAPASGAARRGGRCRTMEVRRRKPDEAEPFLTDEQGGESIAVKALQDRLEQTQRDLALRTQRVVNLRRVCATMRAAWWPTSGAALRCRALRSAGARSARDQWVARVRRDGLDRSPGRRRAARFKMRRSETSLAIGRHLGSPAPTYPCKRRARPLKTRVPASRRSVARTGEREVDPTASGDWLKPAATVAWRYAVVGHPASVKPRG
jgi:hypothetical protein